MDELPESAAVIAEVIGVEPTLLLARHLKPCGNSRRSAGGTTGTRIYIPKKLNDDHWIVRTIGPGLAQKLVRMFGGEQLPLARCVAVTRAEQDRKVAELAAKGKTHVEIAIEFGRTDRWVRKALSRHREAYA